MLTINFIIFVQIKIFVSFVYTFWYTIISFLDISEIFRNFETSNKNKNKRKVYEVFYMDFKKKKNYYA